MRELRTLDQVTEQYFRDRPEEIDDYLTEIFQDFAEDNDTGALLASLRVIVHVQGISDMAAPNILKLSPSEFRWIWVGKSWSIASFAPEVIGLLMGWQPKFKEWKFQLTRRLFEEGFDRQDIMELFLFLDWLMELPRGLKREFRDELDLYQQEKKMPYISSIEEVAMEKVALSLLKERVDIEIISRSTGLSIKQIQELQAEQK